MENALTAPASVLASRIPSTLGGTGNLRTAWDEDPIRPTQGKLGGPGGARLHLTRQPTRFDFARVLFVNVEAPGQDYRDQNPVQLIPELGAWMATRYDDVQRLFSDPPRSRTTGMPPKGDDEQRQKHLARDVIGGINPVIGEEGQKRAENGIIEMRAYIRSLTVERRKQSQDDLISDLVLAHAEAGRISNEEVVLMIAGSDPASQFRRWRIEPGPERNPRFSSWPPCRGRRTAPQADFL